MSNYTVQCPYCDVAKPNHRLPMHMLTEHCAEMAAEPGIVDSLRASCGTAYTLDGKTYYISFGTENGRGTIFKSATWAAKHVHERCNAECKAAHQAKAATLLALVPSMPATPILIATFTNKTKAEACRRFATGSLFCGHRENVNLRPDDQLLMVNTESCHVFAVARAASTFSETNLAELCEYPYEGEDAKYNKHSAEIKDLVVLAAPMSYHDLQALLGVDHEDKCMTNIYKPTHLTWRRAFTKHPQNDLIIERLQCWMNMTFHSHPPAPAPLKVKRLAERIDALEEIAVAADDEVKAVTARITAIEAVAAEVKHRELAVAAAVCLTKTKTDEMASRIAALEEDALMKAARIAELEVDVARQRKIAELEQQLATLRKA
jgi:hypothetical protein